MLIKVRNISKILELSKEAANRLFQMKKIRISIPLLAIMKLK